MPAYVIADVTAVDTALMEEYRRLVASSIARYGGRYVVRGRPLQTLLGDWRPERLVVIEFPSVEHARRWYEYEPHKGPHPLHLKAARTNAVLVEGA